MMNQSRYKIRIFIVTARRTVTCHLAVFQPTGRHALYGLTRIIKIETHMDIHSNTQHATIYETRNICTAFLEHEIFHVWLLYTPAECPL